jgi:hypothetical protein
MKKNKPSKVTFINTLPKMKNIFPQPEPSFKNIPNWYKKLESFYEGDPTPENGNQKLTAKRCVAFLDILSSGYILKCPFDIYIDTTEGKQIFDIPAALKPLTDIGSKQFIGSHDIKQVQGYPFDTNQYIEYLFRINMVWVVKTEPGYSTLYLPLQHHEISPLFPISAVIDSDEYPSNGLLSFLVKKDFKGFIAKGTPLVQVIPFKRQDFISEHLETQEEVDKLNYIGAKIRTVFNSGYKKLLWHKKSYR